MGRTSFPISSLSKTVVLAFNIIIISNNNVAHASCLVPPVGKRQAIFVKESLSDDWSEPLFNDTELSTGAEDLRRKNKMYPLGTVVRYRCLNPDTNTLLKGTEFIECQSNNTWNGSTPVCHPNWCEFKHNSEKEVRFQLGGFVINKTNGSFPRNTELIYVSCLDKSLQLSDDSKLNNEPHQKCMENKTWSGNEPKCVPTRRPKALKNEGCIVGGSAELLFVGFLIIFLKIRE